VKIQRDLSTLSFSDYLLTVAMSLDGPKVFKKQKACAHSTIPWSVHVRVPLLADVYRAVSETSPLPRPVTQICIDYVATKCSLTLDRAWPMLKLGSLATTRNPLGDWSDSDDEKDRPDDVE